MTTGTSIRAAFIAVLAVAAWAASPAGASAAECDLLRLKPDRQPNSAASEHAHIPGISRVENDNDRTRASLPLAVGQSCSFAFEHVIKEVVVGDPQIANVMIRSLPSSEAPGRAYIEANKLGATNIVFFDPKGKQIARLQISVGRDLNAIQDAIRDLVRSSNVIVKSIGDGILLQGTVLSQADAQLAVEIARHFINKGSDFASSSTGSPGTGGGSANSVNVSGGGNASSGSASGPSANSDNSGKVYNAIEVLGREQVLLKVTVAEMDRQVIKQLGINLSGSFGYGSAVVNFNTTNPFPVNGTPSSSVSGGFKGLTATLQAMEQVGVVHTLSEPTLTAISGESAHFLAGGSFPYPVPAGVGSPPSIQFQNYGVGLNFTPVVLSEGRISLHVATEVSQLDATNSVTISGTTVPGLTVRRADTTAEIPSGGTLAMAGMLQDQTKQDITGLPGLMQIPILGTLFKSNDYLNNKTELVVLVTPYIERPVAQKDLSRPDDGFADPSDPASVLLSRLNRIYGVGGIPDPPDNYRGKYGFILD